MVEHHPALAVEVHRLGKVDRRPQGLRDINEKVSTAWFPQCCAPTLITRDMAAMATFLAEHGKIKRLIYPGRPDHPQAETARKQMRAGSTLVAFEIDGDQAATFRFLDALELVAITNNLGDAKSLVTHPATTTHQRLTPEQRAELGISDGLVRFSAGLEHPDDVIEDLLTALNAV